MNVNYPINLSFSKKRVLLAVVVVFLVLLCIYFLFSYNVYAIRKINVKPSDIVRDDNFVCHIERYDEDSQRFEISGYFYNSSQETKIVKMNLVLENVNTNIFYKIPTYITYREDVKDIANNGNDYYWSGFVSIIKKGLKIDIDDEMKVYMLITLDGVTNLVDLNMNTNELRKYVK